VYPLVPKYPPSMLFFYENGDLVVTAQVVGWEYAMPGLRLFFLRFLHCFFWVPLQIVRLMSLVARCRMPLIPTGLSSCPTFLKFASPRYLWGIPAGFDVEFFFNFLSGVRFWSAEHALLFLPSFPSFRIFIVGFEAKPVDFSVPAPVSPSLAPKRRTTTCVCLVLHAFLMRSLSPSDGGCRFRRPVSLYMLRL